MKDIQKLILRLKHEVFEKDDPQRGWLGRALVFWARLLYGIVVKFMDKQFHIQSTSLAYTTLLSLIPLLAVTFSVLKGFGVQNQLEPMLMRSLEPLGDQGMEIGTNVLNFVNNLNVRVLGSTGIALLFWTVISLLQKVEEAFNAIWQVSSMRSLGRRFSDYLSVILVGPVLMVAALGVTASALNYEGVQRIAAIEPFGNLILGMGRLMPYLLICGAFAFLYSFITNTRVRVMPALAGSIFASVAWFTTGQLFATFVASSSKYSAIYSGFAAAILFIIWLNIGWLIILIGAQVARYWQDPHLLRQLNAGPGLEDGRREALAFEVMTLIGHAYYYNEPLWTLEALTARGYGDSAEALEELMGSLREQGLLVATDDDPPAYVPAYAIDAITLQDIAVAARDRGESYARQPAVQAVISRLDTAINEALEGQTLKDLVLAGRPQAVEDNQ